MKPLAEALAALLFIGPSLPAWAADPILPEDPPATEAPAAGSPAGDPPAESGGIADLQKMYDTAIASEKESGKTMVWDGDKMVPAPEGFQNPLTPDAMAEGWRPVMSGNEVVGACNGSVCTAQGLQPDLWGPPASGTTADNLNASTTPPDPAPAPGAPANPPAPMQWNEQGPLAPGQIRLPPPGAEAGRQAPGEAAATPPPAPTQENFAAVNNFVTQNAQNQLDGQNGPNSGTGSPNYGGADNPATGMAFAPDGSGAYDLPPSGGSSPTGGQALGPDGQVAQGGGTGSTGGRNPGKAINCVEAGNCDAVSRNLIEFHEGLKKTRADGPGNPNAISVAQTPERLKSSAAYGEALRAQTGGQSAVSAAVGELTEGISLRDQASTDAGRPFDGSGANRAEVPTGDCTQHIMQSVGVCPSN